MPLRIRRGICLHKRLLLIVWRRDHLSLRDLPRMREHRLFRLPQHASTSELLIAASPRVNIDAVSPTDLLLHPFRKGRVRQPVHRHPMVTDVLLAQFERSGRLMTGKFDDDQMFLLLNLVEDVCGPDHLHFQSRLFPHFTGQRVHQRFCRFQSSTGKIPTVIVPGASFSGGFPEHQDAVPVENDCLGSDFVRFFLGFADGGSPLFRIGKSVFSPLFSFF